MSEILINRVSELFNICKTEAMILIEKYICNGNTDELLTITGIKGGVYDVQSL